MFQNWFHISKKTTHLADDRQLLLDKVMDWLRSNVLPSRSYDQILLSSNDRVEIFIVNCHQIARPEEGSIHVLTEQDLDKD